MTKLKIAQRVAMIPPNLSQPRAGVMMPGIVTRKVTKTMTAFAIPAKDSNVSIAVTVTSLPGLPVLTCEGKCLIQEVSCCLPPIRWCLEPYVLDDDRKREHEDAHEKEEKIRGQIGHGHFGRHRVVAATCSS